MKCMYCQGTMEKSSAPFSADRNGYHISWDAVPAYVCTQCGEPYFEKEQVAHIQSALSKIDAETLAISKQAYKAQRGDR